MTREVIYFSEDDSESHVALSLLIQKGLKMAPVVGKDGVFIGIVSRAHLIEHIKVKKRKLNINIFLGSRELYDRGIWINGLGNSQNDQ